MALCKSEGQLVVDARALSIREIVGRVASKESRLSACIAHARGPAEDAWQTASFDTWALVIEGAAVLHVEGKGEPPVHLSAGQGVFVPRGTKVRWVWPGVCTYVPICIPAYDPDETVREFHGASPAKDDAAMLRLRVLHEELRNPWLYHCAPRPRWEEAKASGGSYFPPTFEQDGKFVHATSNPEVLLGVLNTFYKTQPGEWVCLRMSRAALAAKGVDVIFEPAAPVGDQGAGLKGEAADAGMLFPHILGGIPTSGAVLEETQVVRAPNGEFLQVAGVTAPTRREGGSSLLSRGAPDGFAAGLLLGVCAGALGCLLVLRRA